MVANTAIAVLIASIGFAARELRLRWLPAVCGGIVAIAASAVLGQYVFGQDWHINQFVLRQSSSGVSPFPSGQMAPSTAMAMLLVGGALLCGQLESRRWILAIFGGMIAALAALPLLILVGAAISGEGRDYVGMSLPTMVCLGLFSLETLRSASSGPGRLALPLPLLAGAVGLLLSVGMVSVSSNTRIIEAVKSGVFGANESRAELAVRAGQVIGGVAAIGLIAAAAARAQRMASERDRAERALAASEERFRRLVSDVQDYAIYLVDAEGRVASWNAGAERAKGYSQQEILGRHFSVFHTEEDLAAGKPQRILEEAAAKGRAEDEGWRTRRDGTRFWANVVVTALRNADGALLGYTKVMRDMTERRRAEEALRESREEQIRRNRLKGQFLAHVSHELRTPLNGIVGFAELLVDRRCGPLTAEQEDYLKDILSSARHLLRLIGDLLDLAKIEAGKMAPSLERFSMREAIEEVSGVLSPLFQGKQLSYAATIDLAGDSLVADPKMFRQVLYNLLSNAIKFTPRGGKIALRVRSDEGDRIAVSVADTGIGIAPDDLRRLFVEFEQLETGASQRYQGTGLGLALSKRIVELHGGVIGVESTPKVGSTFWFTLPRSGPPAA